MRAKKAKEYVFSDLLGMEAYCKSHYAEYYSKSNFSCNVTQLTKGELLTSSICAPINDVHLELFKSNQTLLYEEDANQSSVAFCWISDPNRVSESNTIIGGHKMRELSIAGFNRLNKTGGNTWDIVGANTVLCCMSLKWNKLKEQIDKMNAYNAYARLEECIGIDSEAPSSSQLKGLFDKHFQHGVQCSQSFYDLAIATLEDSPESENLLTVRSDKTDLIEDLVKLLHEDRPGLPPLTLTQITQYLNSDAKSLRESCQASFDMSILQLIKSIRLEQVKKSYLNSHVPKGLRRFTMKQNALYYGFNNWTSFEKLYFQTFSESPEESIDKAGAISVLVSDLLRQRK